MLVRRGGGSRRAVLLAGGRLQQGLVDLFEAQHPAAVLLGQPARVETFANLREEVWEWRIEGVPHNEETYFNVFFDTGSGLVTKAGKRVAMKA
jgi:hypothetical protein